VIGIPLKLLPRPGILPGERTRAPLSLRKLTERRVPPPWSGELLSICHLRAEPLLARGDAAWLAVGRSNSHWSVSTCLSELGNNAHIVQLLRAAI
jgi:hypothetical protein